MVTSSEGIRNLIFSRWGCTSAIEPSAVQCRTCAVRGLSGSVLTTRVSTGKRGLLSRPWRKQHQIPREGGQLLLLSSFEGSHSLLLLSLSDTEEVPLSSDKELTTCWSRSRIDSLSHRIDSNDFKLFTIFENHRCSTATGHVDKPPAAIGDA